MNCRVRRYFTAGRDADHGAGAIVDLKLFAGSGLDDRAGFRRLVPAGLTDESLDALISAGEAMRIHQILPDRFGVAASESPHFDDLGIGFAGAG